MVLVVGFVVFNLFYALFKFVSKICGKEFSGSKIREALGLKSTNFNVTLKDNVFTFTVYGYGHGVGMSQHGANVLAKEGKSYDEILKHYYTGVEIETIK